MYPTLGGPVVAWFRATATVATAAPTPRAALAYSYAVVRGGTEIARSPEVTIQLPEVGVPDTRLMPNRPNPFNPETGIHFELAKADRPLPSGVYDVQMEAAAVRDTRKVMFLK